jgi:hypothetical protein
LISVVRAILLRRVKRVDTAGLVEIVLWRVPPTRANPDGLRYRVAFVRPGARTPAVLYDCHEPKGHHRHVEGVETVYHFVDVAQLGRDFTADVRRVIGDPTWDGFAEP